MNIWDIVCGEEKIHEQTKWQSNLTLSTGTLTDAAPKWSSNREIQENSQSEVEERQVAFSWSSEERISIGRKKET